MKDYQIAVIPGDGIGREVVPEGVRVLEAAAARHGLRLKWHEFPWSCDWYKAHGRMCPEDAPAILRKFDAVYFGAVGNPAIVPDHISAWGLLINFRRWFDLYVNLRPVRLFTGVPSPLANRMPGDIDFYVVRENTEGEYSSIGGRIFSGTDREFVVQESVFTRKGVDATVTLTHSRTVDLAAEVRRADLTLAEVAGRARTARERRLIERGLPPQQWSPRLRASLALYNTIDDIDALCAALMRLQVGQVGRGF